MRVRGAIEIAASPEKVWSLIIEREGILQWVPRFKRFDHVGEQHGGLGGMFYFEEIIGDRLSRHLCEVIEWEEGKKLTFRQVLGDVKKLEVVYTVEATKVGSRFTLSYDIMMPYWIIGKIIELLFVRKRMKGEAEVDPVNLKQLAEA